MKKTLLGLCLVSFGLCYGGGNTYAADNDHKTKQVHKPSWSLTKIILAAGIFAVALCDASQHDEIHKTINEQFSNCDNDCKSQEEVCRANYRPPICCSNTGSCDDIYGKMGWKGQHNSDCWSSKNDCRTKCRLQRFEQELAERLCREQSSCEITILENRKITTFTKH